jgi:hypothetical protein
MADGGKAGDRESFIKGLHCPFIKGLHCPSEVRHKFGLLESTNTDSDARVKRNVDSEDITKRASEPNNKMRIVIVYHELDGKNRYFGIISKHPYQ